MEYREFRAEIAENEGGQLTFVAAPFGREAVIGELDQGGWREEIAPGAFTKALRESDTVLLCDHDMSKPLARVSAKTLTLRETPAGLEGEAQLADTSYARDLQINVRAGNKGGMSIGFQPVKDDWYDDDGEPSNRHVGTRRVLREVKLPEVSCVTNPAYKDTSVFARDDSVGLLEQRAASKKPYGDVKYADPKNGKYPIDTEEHIRAAWAYINMPKNASKYPLNGVSLSEVKARIRAAMKKIGAEVEEKSAEEGIFEGDFQFDEYDDPFYESDITAAEGEGRDDPDGREYEAIDQALRMLNAGNIAGAKKVLAANQASRAQEPGFSTPEEDAQLIDSLLSRRFALAAEDF